MKINAVIFFLKHHPSVSQKKSTGFILPKKFLITSLVDSHKLSGIHASASDKRYVPSPEDYGNFGICIDQTEVYLSHRVMGGFY
jgi:hypothetical protein